MTIYGSPTPEPQPEWQPEPQPGWQPEPRPDWRPKPGPEPGSRARRDPGRATGASKHRRFTSRPAIVAGVIVAVLIGAGTAGAASSDWFGGSHDKSSSPITLTPTINPTHPSPTATATKPAPVGQITVSGVGDVIMGTAPGSTPPNAGHGYFDGVSAALHSDLVMGNLEQALSSDTGHVKCGAASTGCFAFHLPSSYAGVLRAGGFDLVNLANNHTMDMGTAGLLSTHAALTKAGIDYTGAPGQITVEDVHGIRVAVIGVAPYPWCQSLTDISGTAALVRKATTMADIVVIQMQAGAEGADKDHVKPGTEIFLGENRGNVLAFSHAMIDAGADLIIGHGPHVMRGMQFYKGRLIAFSMGNFTGYKTLSAAGYTGVGGILHVTLTADGEWVSGTLTATEMVHGGLPALDPAKRALSFVRNLSKEDFGASAATIGANGAISPPKA